jgi:hypothetical protein
MNKILLAGAAALVMMTGVAVAQTSISQTTTTVYPAVGTPVAGTVSTTRTDNTINSDGTQTTSKETTYRNGNGVADDSVIHSTIYPAVALTETDTKITTTVTEIPAPSNPPNPVIRP